VDGNLNAGSALKVRIQAEFRQKNDDQKGTVVLPQRRPMGVRDVTKSCSRVPRLFFLLPLLADDGESGQERGDVEQQDRGLRPGSKNWGTRVGLKRTLGAYPTAKLARSGERDGDSFERWPGGR